jgi:hypothetical protein
MIEQGRARIGEAVDGILTVQFGKTSYGSSLDR